MTIGQGQNKYRFKNWKLSSVLKLLFSGHRAISSRRIAFAFPIRMSVSVFRFPSLANNTPKFLNFSTCCSVTPYFKRALRWVSGRDMIFRSFWCWFSFWMHGSQAGENKPSTCWGPRSEGISSAKSSVKSGQLPLQLPAVTSWSIQLWIQYAFANSF